jgi:hypothetical protein
VVSKQCILLTQWGLLFMRQGVGKYITYRSRRQGGVKDIFNEEGEIRENQPEAEQEEVMGDNNEDIAIQILEGLSAGKQQLTQLLTQLISNNQTHENHGSNNGAGGSNVNNGNNGEGNHPEIPAPNHTRIPV